MNLRTTTLAAGALLAGILGANAPGHAQDAQDAQEACELDRPVMFGGLDYGSAAFHTALARTIIEEGFGCTTDVLPGTTLVLNQGLARGDIDLIMEIWTANAAQAFLDAEEAGDVTRLGATFPDATEGWYVPRYVVEGEDAPAPELKSASDLANYTELFEDPEEPGKGRFLNCVIGWQCEVVNSKKLIAYGLEDDYTNVRPGAGAALEAAVESAYLRERPVVFYHWAPTWLIGKYDFVRLDEPPYDEATWDEMMEAAEPSEATAYPETKVVIGANVEFTEAAPTLTKFLNAYSTTSDQTSRALAYMREQDVEAGEAALHFLRENPDVWRPWVDEAVADRVAEAVAQ